MSMRLKPHPTPDLTLGNEAVITSRPRGRGLGVVAVVGSAASVAVLLVSVATAQREAAFAHAYVHGTMTARKSSSATLPIVPPPLSPAPPVVALKDLTPEQALDANRSIPFSILPNPAAKPFRLGEIAEEDRARAQTCLTQAIYYEAGFEPLAGEQAVAQVVLNRLRHPIFPKTVCGVVFQGAELKTGCQFTFTCDGSMDRPPEAKAWARADAVAAAALDGFVMKTVGEATHYHTQWVVPYWSPSLVKLTQIGAHIFYRWTGTSGQPPAFAGRYLGGEPGAQAPPMVQLAASQTLITASAASADGLPTSDTVASSTTTPPSRASSLIVTQNDPPALVQDVPTVGKIISTPTSYFGTRRSGS